MPIIAGVATAAIGAGTAIYSGSQQKKAAGKALDAQTAANDQARADQQAALAKVEQLQNPFIQSGYGALDQLANEYGLGAPRSQPAYTPQPSYSPPPQPQPQGPGMAGGPGATAAPAGGYPTLTTQEKQVANGYGDGRPYSPEDLKRFGLEDAAVSLAQKQGGAKPAGGPAGTSPMAPATGERPGLDGRLPRAVQAQTAQAAQAPAQPSQPAGPDWAQYGVQHPDVAAGYQAYLKGNAEGFGGANEGQNWGDWGYAPGLSEEQFYQQYQATTGQGAGYQVPQTQPSAPQPQAPQPTTPGQPAVDPYAMPDRARETMARPDQPVWQGAGQAPDQASYFSNFTADPGYQFRLQQGLDSANTGFAARGMLKSGAAAKGVMDYSSGLASQEYNNWFNRQNTLYNGATNQYNQDRSANYNIFNTERSNLNNNFENDRSRADNVFSEDRSFDKASSIDARNYDTGRVDQRTSNLFDLARLGSGAAGTVGGASQNYANNSGNIFANQAGAAGAAANANAGANAGMVGAIGGAASNMFNNWNFRSPAPTPQSHLNIGAAPTMALPDYNSLTRLPAVF